MFECKTLVANFGFMIEEEGKYDDESGEVCNELLKYMQ